MAGDDVQPPPASQPQEPLLKGKQVLVGVCGGIAAYKVADLVSKLAQRGAAVRVCMTPAATQFVTPLTFQALSGRPVVLDIFDTSSHTQHIALTEEADLMLVAPATADILAKVAGGICDDIVSLLVCAAACPVVFAPAMNARMWDNPITQQNVKKLSEVMAYRFIGPEPGWLACRAVGPGRMSEPQTLLEELTRMLLPPVAV